MNSSNKSTSRALFGISARLMLGTALTGVVALLATNASAQNETVTVTGTTIRGQVPVGANVITVDRATIEATGAQTTAQLLVTIPQLDNFGSAAQGGQNSSDSTAQAPTIHSLGNSASNSTLILIDGHRLPLTGLSHNLIDPSIIPTAALSNVEVLPDGASAIYGSDAVAGVINFHTRKDYSGWETSVQVGVADHYSSFDFSQLFGHSWDNGGLVAVYNYSSRSNLMNINRDFITARQDIRRGAVDPSLFTGIPSASSYAGLQTVTASGPGIAGGVAGGLPVPYPSDGGNFQNFTSCPVATISTTSSAAVGVFAYPYTGTAYPRQTTPTGGPGTGICDTGNFASALPSEVRNQGLISIHQGLSERLSMNLDVVYSSRLDASRSAVGGISNAVAFSPFVGTGGPAFGSNQANPFYVTVPGATGSQRNSEFVSLDFTQLLRDRGLSPGYSSDKSGQITVFASAGLDYDLGGDWLFSLGGTAGSDNSFDRPVGSLNSAEALLALNGTTQSGGTAATGPASSVVVDPYGLGTTLQVTRALTTANALDVWNTSAGNRTSNSVLRSMLDSANNTTSVQGFDNVTVHADGPLGDYWGAGQIKAAFGGEWIHYTQDIRNTFSSGAGPVSTSSRFFTTEFNRTVFSTYAEFVVPLIGPDMNVPLIRNLVLDVAGRYDHYNDFGETKNPKIAFNWDIIDGIRTSASFGTSFTAPALNSVGAPPTYLIPNAAVAANNSGAANNLVVLFNDTRAFNNFAGIAGTFVSNPYACAAAGSTVVTDATGNTIATPVGGIYGSNAAGCKIVNQNNTGSQGLSIYTGNKELRPELGQSYSANLVFDDFGKFVDVLQGLSAQVTYYQAKFTGAVTNGGIATSSANAGLPQLTTFAPANCSSATPPVCTPGWAQTDPVVQQLLVQAPLSNPLPATIYSIQSNEQQNAFNLWQNGIDFSLNYRFHTDNFGDFSFGMNGNQILRASQQNGPTGVPFDTKDGRNGGRFTNIEFTGRANVNWHMDPFTVGVSVNFQHPYNTGVSTFPFNLSGPVDASTDCGFTRCAGIEHISALQTYDLNLAYNLPDDWMSGASMNVTVSNVLDTNPPYRDNSSGSAGGSAIGRQINIALRKKW